MRQPRNGPTSSARPRWLAVGFLAGRRHQGDLDGVGVLAEVPGLPWNSDDLSMAVGVKAPGGDVRHTALGDARWAKALYEKVTGGEAVEA
jgi:DNA polymerase III epsilon subunit-like protein